MNILNKLRDAAIEIGRFAKHQKYVLISCTALSLTPLRFMNPWIAHPIAASAATLTFATAGFLEIKRDLDKQKQQNQLSNEKHYISVNFAAFSFFAPALAIGSTLTGLALHDSNHVNGYMRDQIGYRLEDFDATTPLRRGDVLHGKIRGGDFTIRIINVDRDIETVLGPRKIFTIQAGFESPAALKGHKSTYEKDSFDTPSLPVGFPPRPELRDPPLPQDTPLQR